MWGNKGYDQIIDDEEEQENHHHHIFRFKTLHRNPITSLIILGIIIVAVIFCIRFFFASPTAALVTDGVIVYIKLQSGQYLTGSKTGGVKTTAVPWLNGSRFELKQMSRTKYQLSSLASNTAIVIDSSTNKIRGEDDYYGNPLVLTRKSGSSFEYESRHRLEVDKEGSLVVSTSSHIPYALFTVEPVEKIKGTNIGSWLIPERWMYSPFYDGVDVYFSQVCGLVATLGIPAAEKRIIEHLDTWFTEKDMDQLVAVGVRHIRIPIGFWNLVPSKLAKKFVPQNVSTSLKYLDWAMDETAKRGITVMLDFHGG